MFECDQSNFTTIKEMHGLKCDYNTFQTMLIRYFTNAIEDPEKYKCYLIMRSDATAQFIFIQDFQFKNTQLLSLEMKLGDEDEIN